MQKYFYLKITNNKNNTFISISNYRGILLTYKSFKEKKTKDIKSRLTLGLIHILKKLKNNKIKFINLNINNINIECVQHLFLLLKTFNVIINSIKVDLNIPHNGCRKSRKSRKRNKSRKKSKSIL